jgi:folylpolyglutamate synthase/dihydropteroate synthase
LAESILGQNGFSALPAAMEEVLLGNEPLVICGSFYIMGDMLQEMLKKSIPPACGSFRRKRFSNSLT